MTGISKPVIYDYVKEFKNHFPGLSRGRYNALRFTEKDVELILKIRRQNKNENFSIDEIKKDMETGTNPKDSWNRVFELAEIMAVKLSEQDASLNLLLNENIKLKEEVFSVKVMMASKMTEEKK
jgi:DNA-binding transcriptional MerR regulator